MNTVNGKDGKRNKKLSKVLCTCTYFHPKPVWSETFVAEETVNDALKVKILLFYDL